VHEGHIGYVLEGELQISFPDKNLRLSTGDGIFILGGESEKQKASVIGDNATLVLVEAT
jgi:hypothetical protein